MRIYLIFHFSDYNQLYADLNHVIYYLVNHLMFTPMWETH
jgi:hypothetical protein